MVGHLCLGVSLAAAAGLERVERRFLVSDVIRRLVLRPTAGGGAGARHEGRTKGRKGHTTTKLEVLRAPGVAQLPWSLPAVPWASWTSRPRPSNITGGVAKGAPTRLFTGAESPLSKEKE